MWREAWRALFGQGRGKVLLFCWLGWVFDFYDLILFIFVKDQIAAELGISLEHADRILYYLADHQDQIDTIDVLSRF